MSEEPVRPLPLLAILRNAILLPMQHGREVLRVASLPLIAVIAATMTWQLAAAEQDQFGRSVMLLFQLFAISWLAVTLHRLVLLDEEQARANLAVGTWLRIAKYAMYFAGLWILFIALKLLLVSGVMLAFGTTYVPTGEQPPPTPGWFEWLDLPSTLVALLAVSRLCLVAPAAAVDRDAGLAAAWQRSRGHALRLTVVIGLLPWCFGKLIEMLDRHVVSSAGITGLVLLGTVLTVFEIVALSLSYEALTALSASPAPPPTDPPA
jgi:hypothetical protein